MRVLDPNARGVASARTVLEEQIKKRQLTLEEFIAYVERFAREHGEPGTISLRNLQRLIAGNGNPQRTRPSTARLLEKIFGEDIEYLLASTLPKGDGGRNVRVGLVSNTPHLLRVAVTIVVRDAKVLLVVRRAPFVEFGTPWQFPAGVIKPGVESRDVAVSETLAETGVHTVHVRLIGVRLHPITHEHCEYHLCNYVAGEPLNYDKVENSGVAWVDVDRVSQIIPAHTIFPPVLTQLTS